MIYIGEIPLYLGGVSPPSLLSGDGTRYAHVLLLDPLGCRWRWLGGRFGHTPHHLGGDTENGGGVCLR